jgi:hypothetical protein
LNTDPSKTSIGELLGKENRCLKRKTTEPVVKTGSASGRLLGKCNHKISTVMTKELEGGINA